MPAGPSRANCRPEQMQQRKQIRAEPNLLDHLVGVQQHRLRDGQPHRFRGLEVDYKLEFGWRLHRQLGGLLALEDAINIDRASILSRDSCEGLGRGGGAAMENRGPFDRSFSLAVEAFIDFFLPRLRNPARPTVLPTRALRDGYRRFP